MSADNQTHTLNESCKASAAALHEASALLVCTGAGFSADSGLPVYNDVANDPVYKKKELSYVALSTPSMLVKDKEMFYGFWCHCHNLYQTTKPHEGYDILKKWKKRVATSRNTAAAEIESCSAEVFAVSFTDVVTNNKIVFSHGGMPNVLKYTVDPVNDSPRTCLIHKVCYESSKKRLLLFPDAAGEAPNKAVNLPRDCEILTLLPKVKRLLTKLGVPNNIESSNLRETDYDKAAADAVSACFYLATSNVDGHFRKKGFSKKELYELHGSIDYWQCSKPCTKQITKMPSDIIFEINDEKRMTNSSKTPALNCTVCCGPMRPAICMFADSNYIENDESEDQFLQWKQSVARAAEKLSANNPAASFNFVILEIGAGKKVTTIRNLTRELSKSVSASGGKVTTIRVNPVDFDQDKVLNLRRSSSLTDIPSMVGTEKFISVKSGGLTALQTIDTFLEQLDEGSN